MSIKTCYHMSKILCYKYDDVPRDFPVFLNHTQQKTHFRLNNLFSIVDNIEQCGQHNIVQSCFQKPSTTRNFYAW